MIDKSTPQSMGNIGSIQTLRAIAALIVLLSHLAKELNRNQNILFYDWLNVTYSGQFGVDVFFVISGFIMIVSTQQEVGKLGASRRFLLRRIIRLAPLYWLLTSLTIAITLLEPALRNHNDMGWQYVLSSYLFIPFNRISDNHLTPVLGVGWTLNYEMLFYLIFAFGLTFPARHYTKVIIVAFLTLSLAGITISADLPQLWFWTRPIILEFLLGALIGSALIRGKRIPSLVGYVTMGGALIWWQTASNILDDPTLPQYRLFTWGIPAGLIVLASTLPNKTLFDFLPKSTKQLTSRLGDGSYSLYLVHMFIIRTATIFLPIGLLGAFYVPIYIALTILLSFVAADFMYFYVERPTQKFFRKIMKI